MFTKSNEINDTWLNYTPESGYPIEAVRKRARVTPPKLDSDVAEPARHKIVRAAFYVGAGVCYAGAFVWVGSFFVG